MTVLRSYDENIFLPFVCTAMIFFLCVTSGIESQDGKSDQTCSRWMIDRYFYGSYSMDAFVRLLQLPLKIYWRWNSFLFSSSIKIKEHKFNGRNRLFLNVQKLTERIKHWLTKNFFSYRQFDDHVVELPFLIENSIIQMLLIQYKISFLRHWITVVAIFPYVVSISSFSSLFSCRLSLKAIINFSILMRYISYKKCDYHDLNLSYPIKE